MAFSGFDDYNRKKRLKLDFQAEEYIQTINGVDLLPKIFFQLVFFLDGFMGATSSAELKEMILIRGGKVRDWYDSSTTHVIATQMTDSKMQKWKKPIVKPEWILDCVKEDRLLDHKKYILEHSDSNNFQKKLNVSVQNIPSKRYANRPDINMNSEWVKLNSAVAPDFVSRYFESSRLHHISTWRNELIEYVKQRLPNRKVSGQQMVMHVDMDCFFVSASIRDKPELADKPVVVAHSSGKNGKSTSELASCNYAARSFGIQNGMTIGKARTLCPDLIVVSYDFESYDLISKNVYDILLKYANEIQAVSVDEAFIQISATNEIYQVAQNIKQEIFESTKCTASIGIADNMLLARVATTKAKPNGVFMIDSSNIHANYFLLPVEKIPGIGYSMSARLNDMGIESCLDLQKVPLSELKQNFGEKTGIMLYEFSRGIDKRPLQNQERQSVSAEVNWGIRFETNQQVTNFMTDLSNEVSKRLAQTGKLTKMVTLKVKKRKGELEAYKILGCGECDTFSKSVQIDHCTSDKALIFKKSMELLGKFEFDPVEIRGIGIHLSKLESHISKKTKTLDSFIKNAKTTNKQQQKYEIQGKIDMAVYKSLPVSIQKEFKHLVSETIPANLPNSKPKFLGVCDSDMVKGKLDEWIENLICIPPEDFQLKILEDYLKELVLEKYLDDVVSVSKFIKRKLQKCESSHWSKLLNNVLFLVDILLYEQYGVNAAF